MNGYTFERRELKYRITDAPLCEHPPQSSQQPQRKTAAAAVCRKSLAEFAHAGANKVQSIFSSRLANVRA